MATDKTARTNGSPDREGDSSGTLVGVMNSAQEAAQVTAGKVRSAAETAADKLPAAMSTAQDVSRDTAQTLDSLPDQALMVGTSFSLGLGAGLILSGSNRLLVLIALAPAAAMAATLLNRDKDGARRVGLGNRAPR